MEPIKRIQNCINWIVSRFPFFASILIPLNLQEDKSLKTAATNGIELKFNPDFIASLSRDHLIFLLLHESAHLFFKHHLRMQGKNSRIWNQATDYIINNWLINQGFKAIPDILIDSKFSNMPSEKVYNILMQEKQEEKQEKSENLGEIEPFPTNDPGELENQEKEIDSKIQQGGILGELAGNSSGFLQEWINQQKIAKLSIKEILQDISSKICKNDFTWNRPNFRYINQAYLPSLHNLVLGKIACFVDASASVDLDLFNTFITEIIDAKNQGIEFDLFLFDVSVYQELLDFQGDEKIQISGGGTDFNCIPVKLKEIQEDYAAVLILTDGGSTIDSPLEDSYWLIYNNNTFKHEAGKVFYVEN